MKQSKIEEIIDESFECLIDTMFKFPENPYHINFEEIFFKGKADLIHRFEKIMNQKDKQIDLMAENIELQQYANIDVTDLDLICKDIKCNKKCRTVKKACIKQSFERKARNEHQPSKIRDSEPNTNLVEKEEIWKKI